MQINRKLVLLFITLSLSLALWAFYFFGFLSFEPTLKLKTTNLQIEEFEITVNSIKKFTNSCLALKIRSEDKFDFKLVLKNAEVDTVFAIREFSSLNRNEDTIHRENITSYFGDKINRGNELIAGNFDIPKNVNKIKVIYIPRSSKGGVEIWFKAFRICNN